jgi:hypothetical protein
MADLPEGGWQRSLKQDEKSRLQNAAVSDAAQAAQIQKIQAEYDSFLDELQHDDERDRGTFADE